MGNYIIARRKKKVYDKEFILIKNDQTEVIIKSFPFHSSDHILDINLPIINEETEQETSKKIKVRALYSYKSDNSGDLKFNKGDFLLVTRHPKNSWWKAEHMTSGETGFIPRNYVVIDDDSPESLDGFFLIGRIEAEKKLILPGYEEGTYILRPMIRNKCYALSIRMYDPDKGYFVVKHFKIQIMDSGYFCITPKKQYADMKTFITYHHGNVGDLGCVLKKPFPKRNKPTIQFRDIEVNRNCIRLCKKIGGGRFGFVWLAKWNDSIDVAVKTLRGDSMELGRRNVFLDEARLMHKLYHPRIVQLLGICSETLDKPIFIITEYMSKGSLVNLLHKEEGKTLTLIDMIIMMTQIADGMSYLESENLIHRDLRASNILVADDLSVKVADFGLAGVVDDTYGNKAESKFPVRWTAPEAGLRQKFSTKSDVWSFGVLIYEIVTYGQLPYANIQVQDVLTATARGHRLEQPFGEKIMCPIELYNIMNSCWEANPEKRPTFAHLKDLFDHYHIHNEDKYEVVKGF